jgi:hypothetical protein
VSALPDEQSERVPQFDPEPSEDDFDPADLNDGEDWEWEP